MRLLLIRNRLLQVHYSNGGPSSGKQGAVWDKVKNSAWGKQTSQTGKELAEE